MARRSFPPPTRWNLRPRFYKAPNAPDLTVPVREIFRQAPKFRRISKTRSRRGSFYKAPFPPDLTVPVPQVLRQAPKFLRISKTRARRGAVYSPQFPPDLTVPVPKTLRISRVAWRKRPVPVRQGNFYGQDVLLAQLQPVKVNSRKRPWPRRAASGQFFPFSPDMTAAPLVAGPNRLIRPKLRRRGRFFDPPAPPDLTAPVPVASGYDHDRLARPPRVRSAGFFAVPQAPALVTSATQPPALLRPVRRVWPTKARAGNFLADVVPVQIIPTEITTRNRLWPPRIRSGRVFAPPAPPDLTAPTPANRRALRQIHPSLARGSFYGPPASPDLTAPVPLATRIARRIQTPRARAGQFFKVGLGAITQQTVQALPPSIARMIRPVHPSRSRGRYFAPPAPPDLTTPVPLVERINHRIWPAKTRGRFLSVPQVPAALSALPPAQSRALRRPLPALRRARYATIPASQPVPLWCSTRRARAIPAPRRGHQISPPAPPDLTAPLPKITRRPRFDTPCRRGHFTAVFPADLMAPMPRITRRPRFAAPCKRGHFAPVQPPLPNPPWCPSAGQSGKRRHRPRWVRRGQIFSPHLVGIGVGPIGNLSITGDALPAGVIGDPLSASVAGDRLTAVASGDPGTMTVSGDPAPPTVS